MSHRQLKPYCLTTSIRYCPTTTGSWEGIIRLVQARYCPAGPKNITMDILEGSPASQKYHHEPISSIKTLLTLKCFWSMSCNFISNKRLLTVTLNMIRLSNFICQILDFWWSDACVVNVICLGCRCKQSQTEIPTSLQWANWQNDFVEINKQNQMFNRICAVQTLICLVLFRHVAILGMKCYSANLNMHKSRNTNIQVGTSFRTTQTWTLIRIYQWNIYSLNPDMDLAQTLHG